MAHRCTSMIKNGPSMYRLKQAHPSMYRIFEKKKGPIDVPGSLILRPMFAAHPYNHFCTEYPPGHILCHLILLEVNPIQILLIHVSMKHRRNKHIFFNATYNHMKLHCCNINSIFWKKKKRKKEKEKKEKRK